MPRGAAAKRRLRSGELWSPQKRGIKFLVGWIKSHKNSVIHSLFHSKLSFKNLFKLLFSQSFPRFSRGRVHAFTFRRHKASGEDRSGSIQELYFQCMCVPQYILVMGLSVVYDRNKPQVKELTFIMLDIDCHGFSTEDSVSQKTRIEEPIPSPSRTGHFLKQE